MVRYGVVLWWQVSDRYVKAISVILVCLIVAFVAVAEESARFEPPHLLRAPILDAPLIASVTIERSDLNADPGRSEIESHRAVFYRNSDGKTRTDTFATISGDEQRKPDFIEITDLKLGITEMLDPSTHLNHRIAVKELPFVMSGCCPDKMVAFQSAELSLIRTAGLQPPPLGPGWRGDSIDVEPISGIEAFDVEGYGERLTFPGGNNGNRENITIAVKSWYAPTIKAVLAMEMSDSRSGVTRIRLSHIQLREPQASLFTIPSEYRVVEHKAGPEK